MAFIYIKDFGNLQIEMDVQSFMNSSNHTSNFQSTNEVVGKPENVNTHLVNISFF